jgi:hypothetical protein
LSYLPGYFDSIQLREPDIQHNQVRLQFFGLLNGFQSIGSLGYDLPFWPCLK